MFKFFLEVEAFFKKVFTLFHKGHAIYEKAEIKEKHPEQYAQLNNHNAPKVG